MVGFMACWGIVLGVGTSKSIASAKNRINDRIRLLRASLRLSRKPQDFSANREIFRRHSRYAEFHDHELPASHASSRWTAGVNAFATTRILLIAGPKSHGPGQHEHPAGCDLLAKHLQTSGLPITVEVSQGWPQDAAKVAAADTLVIYGDGIGAHPANGHLAELRQRYDAGKGLAVLHWALEPKDAEMAKFFDDAIGGHFEANWSVNPIWKMTQPILANHPATRGVEPFEVEDEFYYHLRLRADVTPLLQALPPADSRGRRRPTLGQSRRAQGTRRPHPANARLGGGKS